MGILGDIVLCPAYLGPQAAAAGRSLDEELQFLTTHGMLHLIGHDHQSPESYEAMFSLQDDLLAGLFRLEFIFWIAKPDGQGVAHLVIIDFDSDHMRPSSALFLPAVILINDFLSYKFFPRVQYFLPDTSSL